ncbi:MAG TPA: glycerophosphodiester phosphodiesterase [Tepidiformaceae bacterium]|nr:glycerophosphodiester phosphodiesterase [Tepidiformaceae bacterium]
MKPYVLVLGHACAAGEAPANTLAGVRACIDAGVEGMEIDVQLCADGVPVLMHDDTVDRTTNLRGPVREKTLAELQAADAGDGEPVPTLDQVLALVAGRFTVMCELKATPDAPDQDQACVDAVVEVIRRHNAESWTAIHSFNPIMVERARATEPRISATIITGQIRGEVVDRLLGGLMKRHGQAISVEHHVVDRTLIEKAKKRQVTVWTWTVDKPEDWARVVEAGVDGIITNVPHRLREWLNQL